MRRTIVRPITLEDIGELCREDAALGHFAEYCRLKGLGLRKPALAQLERFIAVAADLDPAPRFEVVDRLFELDDRAQIPYLLPHPLLMRLMRPACEAQILNNDRDPRPYRWLGFQDNWRKALQLDPDDGIARRRWSKALWKEVDYAVHELPAGLLAPVVELTEMVLNLDQLSKGPGGLGAWPQSWLRELATSYLAYSRSGAKTRFAQWAAANGRPSSPADFPDIFP